MSDLLLSSVLKSIWCNPSRDNQLILKIARLTKISGTHRRFKVMNTEYPMPDNVNRYHVFMIGNAHPLSVNLFDNFSASNPFSWNTFLQSINYGNNGIGMSCDIYTDEGIQLPKHEVYYTYGVNNALIVAIKENSRVPIKYGEDDIYIRLYTPSYYNTPEAQSGSFNGIDLYSVTINSANDIVAARNTYLNYANTNYVFKSFVNGVYINNLLTYINLNLLVIGDAVELSIDNSFVKAIDLTLSELQSFTSELDSKSKYLLHYEDQDNTTLDFYDDNDIFIVDNGLVELGVPIGKGVYYHRNNEDAVRMVTHRDYSIVTDYVQNYLNKLQEIAGTQHVIDSTKIIVKIIIRTTSFARDLVYENNRIKDLYKLPNDLLVDNLLGDGLERWFASNLENSNYCKLMGKRYQDISLTEVQDTLGYNGSSLLLGNTPTVPHSTGLTTSQIDIPYGLKFKSSLYEYHDGKLLNIENITDNTQKVFNVTGVNDINLVENIFGHANTYPFAANTSVSHLGWFVDGNNSTSTFTSNNYLDLIPSGSGYRVYVTGIRPGGDTSGIPYFSYQGFQWFNDWTDVTGDNSWYSVSGTRLTYSKNSTIEPVLFMVRRDDVILSYDISLPITDGNLTFNLVEPWDYYNGNAHVITNTVMQVPMGELDIFLNGYSLIPDLDYYIDFPKIVITNQGRIKSGNQDIHVRFTGFCKPDLTMQDVGDTGFVVNGTMSSNHNYNISDGKVLRVVVDNRLLTKQADGVYGVGNDTVHGHTVSFAEISDGYTSTLEGLPYQVKDIIVPMNYTEDIDTYTYRNNSILVDKEISDYLTAVLPQLQQQVLNTVIGSKYIVFSPFISSVINAIQNNTFSDVVLEAADTDNKVIDLVKPYEVWLPFDPIYNDINSNYVAVQPRIDGAAFGLNLFQYRFLLAVVRLYCRGLINLSQYVYVI